MRNIYICVVFVVSTFTSSLFGQGCPSNNTTFNYQSVDAAGTWITGGAPSANWTFPHPNNTTWIRPSGYTFQGTTYSPAIVIPSGSILQIRSSNFSLVGYYLIVEGSLTFDQGKLNLDADKTIIVASGGTVCCTNTCNASNVISVGSTNVWGGGGGSTGTVTGPAVVTGGVLPITLNSFSASVAGSKVKLNWSTSSELNFDYFSLARSTNGKDFAEIAQIKGQGTTTEKHDYSFDDTNPFIGKNYYKLTSIDFDGYTESFKVVSVDFSGEKNVNVTPNPTNGSKIFFKWNFPVEAGAAVTVFDNLGGVIGTYKVQEDNSISFAETLKGGIYYAKFSSNEFSKVTRFVVSE